MSALAADAEAKARTVLDRVEKTMKPGEGRADLFAFLRGTTARGAAGVGLDVQHRLSSHGALFAQGWAGATWDEGRRELGAELLAGGRLTW